MRRTLLALGVVFQMAQSQALENSISSSTSSSFSTASLQQLLQSSVQQIRRAPLTAKTCMTTLGPLQQELQKVRVESFSPEELKKNSRDFLRLFWDLRLELHQKLPAMSRDCVLQTQKIFNTSRDLEDYFLEFAYQPEALTPDKVPFQKQAVPILDRAAYPPYWIRKDLDTDPFEFQAGDLAIARGVSFISAIISQISVPSSHFSHVVFFAVDKAQNLRQTVESYVGAGVKVFDLDFALKNENVRLLILRPKDTNLGRKAMDFALKDAREKKAYDYKMDFNNSQERSCVELPTSAYAQASGHTLDLPTYRSKLELTNEPFLKAMNLQRGELITPDDLEVDPHFDLILDWRDPRLIRDSRQKDAVLRALVLWLDRHHYEFQETLNSWIAKNILLPLSKTPLWTLLQKIPGMPPLDRNTPRSTLGVMASLDKVATLLVKELRAQDEAFVKSHQRPMSNAQLRQALEELRQKDLAAYRAGQDSLFHQAFRPDKIKKD